MNLSIALIRSFLLLLPAFLIFSGIPMVAVADNNVDALQNIIRAEKLFEIEDDKNALLLLKKALRDQRTNGKEYGYARYIHYRLAKHYHSKGQKARAKQELNRALKIDTSKYVKHHYQVSTSDPLIVSYFPRFHSRKSFRVKKNRYYMGVRWLSNCNSPTIFGMSRDSILSIDRQKRKITEILSENGTGSCAPPSYKYAFKGPSCIGIKSEDCSRHLINVVISKENMHFFASTPFFHQKRHLPSRNKKFFLDSNFENLVEYTNSPCRVRMHSPLKNSGSGYRSFRPDGDCLGMNYNHAIWGSYNDDRHRRIVGTPDYKRFVAHDFRDDSSIVLYEFKRPTFSNHTAIITSDDISSVFFEDEFRKKSFLLLHDWKTKTTKTVQFPYMDFLTSREKQIRYLLNTARFSVSENYYLIAALRKKHLIIFRVDLASDDLERIDLGPIAPFSGSHAWYKLRGFGFLKDKSSFWFQFDNVLLIIDNQFKSYKVDLSPYSLKESKWIQWVHGTRFYTNPDEFYFSAEGKPGLYKIRISLAEALRHAQPAVETPSPE
ncbi:MAG: hypothetical protein GY854_00460, partial [Deltaproteobacteria bacterium]|nr:hypothetical protein [Deltaproteobacteria bacterium]